MSYELLAFSQRDVLVSLSNGKGVYMQDFRGLRVWQKSHQLALEVYRATAGFPKEEWYGLRSQIRRCSYSIPSNIAEGCGRGTDAEFGRFLQIAMGSASELEYFLLLVHDLAMLAPEIHKRLESEVNEVRRMLNSFLQTVKQGVVRLGRRLLFRFRWPGRVRGRPLVLRLSGESLSTLDT